MAEAQLLLLRLEAEASASRNALLATTASIQEEKLRMANERFKSIVGYVEDSLLDVAEMLNLHPEHSGIPPFSLTFTHLPLEKQMEELKYRLNVLKGYQRSFFLSAE